MTHPPFSVVMNIHHAIDTAHFEEAFNSILNQTVPPSEIVLVEDGPLSESLNLLISKFEQSAGGKLTRVQLTDHVGVVKARNETLRHAAHELLAQMDGDDISVPDRFEKQLDFFKENPGYALVGGQVEEFLVEKGDTGQVRSLPLSHEEIINYAKKRCPFNHPSVMYRKSVLEKVGGYQEFSAVSGQSFEDYYLWARIIHAGYKVANLPDVLLYFRLGDNFVKRRKGLSYGIREYHLLRALHKLKFLNRKEYLHNILRRIPLRMMPDFIVKWVYWYFLRK